MQIPVCCATAIAKHPQAQALRIHRRVVITGNAVVVPPAGLQSLGTFEQSQAPLVQRIALLAAAIAGSGNIHSGRAMPVSNSACVQALAAGSPADARLLRPMFCNRRDAVHELIADARGQTLGQLRH